MSARSLGNRRTAFPDPRHALDDQAAKLVQDAADEVRRSGRASRWRRRSQVQEITSIGRVRRCGSMRDPQAGTVLVLTDRGEQGRTAGIEGLVSCGSVWSCPVCAAKVAAKRAEELATVLDKVHESGGSAFMLTLTIKHSAGDRLGLSKDERHRRGVLDRRRKWRQRLDKIADRRDHREVAEAKGWDVDKHQADADDIAEASIRKDIRKNDPDFASVGRAAREQRERDERELVELNGKQGCWDAVTGAWHAATSGRAWAEAQDRAGLLGWVRVTEVTDGGSPAVIRALGPEAHGLSGNGWHVHVHALLCFRDDVSEEYAAAALGAGMHARWAATARELGFDSSEQHGWDLRKTRRGDGDNLHSYFVKQAHEVTGAHRKEGRRRGGRTPMQLLAEAVESYAVEHVARWWEWETAAQGRRQLTWSTGARSLRALAGLGAEQTDEQVADESLDGEQRLGLPHDTARWLRSHDMYPGLLDAAEVGGLDGARRWMAGHGLEWDDKPPPREEFHSSGGSPQHASEEYVAGMGAAPATQGQLWPAARSS